MTRSRALVLCVALLAACGGGPERAGPTGPPAGAPSSGTPDPGWTLRTLDGDEVRLGDFRGRPVVLNLWATWCPPCVAELASLERLAERVADGGTAFLLVTAEDPASVRRFLSRNRLTLPVHLEVTLAPAAFGAVVLPTTFVLDAGGRIVLGHRGATAWDTAAMEALLRALDPVEAS